MRVIRGSGMLLREKPWAWDLLSGNSDLVPILKAPRIKSTPSIVYDSGVTNYVLEVTYTHTRNMPAGWSNPTNGLAAACLWHAFGLARNF